MSKNDEAKRFGPRFSEQDVEIVSKTPKYKGFFELVELKLRHKLFAGGWSKEFTRELFVRRPAVVVLPYDPVTDQVVIQEQFRIGALLDKRSPWLIELVAGMVEPGETPEDVAHREAWEEAGCKIKALELISEYWVSPGGTDELISVYCAWVDASGLGGIHGLPQENEDIRAEVISADTAINALEDGTINNAASIIALRWLQMNRTRIQELWQG